MTDISLMGVMERLTSGMELLRLRIADRLRRKRHLRARVDGAQNI